ncbi:hypothetical protein LZC95_48930 [Pendulispora brunnea]|uniref:Uncharacterized protein n=1 Tax=Pendulispora brunnea TaxID=2905690 RepID=A0ABZ2KBV1_9BACT
MKVNPFFKKEIPIKTMFDALFNTILSNKVNVGMEHINDPKFEKPFHAQVENLEECGRRIEKAFDRAGHRKLVSFLEEGTRLKA